MTTLLKSLKATCSKIEIKCVLSVLNVIKWYLAEQTKTKLISPVFVHQSDIKQQWHIMGGKNE